MFKKILYLTLLFTIVLSLNFVVASAGTFTFDDADPVAIEAKISLVEACTDTDVEINIEVEATIADIDLHNDVNLVTINVTPGVTESQISFDSYASVTEFVVNGDGITILLGDITKDVIVNGTGEVDVGFTSIESGKTLTLTGTATCSQAGGIYVVLGGNKVFCHSVAEALAIKGDANPLYLNNSTSTYELGAITKDLTVNGLAGEVTVSYTSIADEKKLTLKGSTATGNVVYLVPSDGVKEYYSSIEAAKTAMSDGGTLYTSSNSTYALGDITKSMTVSGEGTATFAIITEGVTLTLDGLDNGGSGIYLIDSEGKKVYYLSFQKAQTAMGDVGTINFDTSGSTYELGAITKNMTISGNGSEINISYTSIASEKTIIIEDGVNVEGGVYLKNDADETVYYSNAQAGISAINNTTPDYSNDDILYFSGSSTMVHDLGVISTSLMIQGDGNVKVSYDSIDSQKTLTIKSGAVTTGGYYLIDGTDKVYYTDMATALFVGDTQTVNLDASTTTYNLGQVDDDWVINGPSGAKYSFEGINTGETLTVEGSAVGTRGYYLKSGSDKVYYGSLAATLTARNDDTAVVVYLDTSTTTYALGAITDDLVVSGSATVSYTSIEDGKTLTLQGGAICSNDVAYKQVGTGDEQYRAYYHNLAKTITECGTTDSTLYLPASTTTYDLGDVGVNLVVSSTETVKVKYTSISSTKSLTLKATVVKEKLEDGVYILSGTDKVYYATAHEAVVAVEILLDSTTPIYIEQSGDESSYDLGELAKDIVCKTASGNTKDVNIGYTLSTEASLTITPTEDIFIEAGSPADIYNQNLNGTLTFYQNLEQAVLKYDATKSDALFIDPTAPKTIELSSILTLDKAITIAGSTEHLVTISSSAGTAIAIDKEDVVLYNFALTYAGSADENIGINAYGNDGISFGNLAITGYATGILAEDETSLDGAIGECTFLNCTRGIVITNEDGPYIYDNSFSGNTQDITLVEDYTDEEVEALSSYLSRLKIGNNNATIFVNDAEVTDIGDYFLSYLKINGEDFYHLGDNAYYQLVPTTTSTAKIEAKTHATSSSLTGGLTTYTKTVDLDIEQVEEVSFTCTADNGVAETYTIYLYRQAPTDTVVSEMVGSTSELYDGIQLVSRLNSQGALPANVILDNMTNISVDISEEDIEFAKDSGVEIVIFFENIFMVIAPDSLPALPTGTYYRFSATAPAADSSKPNDLDKVLKRTEITIETTAGVTIVPAESIVIGIDTSDLDLDDYDTSKIKIYYHAANGTYALVAGAQYFLSEGVVTFSAPHFSEYTLTAQDAPPANYRGSLTATLLDLNDDPIEGYKIVIEGESRTTNSAGEVTFSSMGIASGTVNIVNTSGSTVYTGPISFTLGSTAAWTFSNDNLAITYTGDTSTIDVLFEYTASGDIDVTDVDFYYNPKTGHPFKLNTWYGYSLIFVALATVLGLSFMLKKKFSN